LISAESARNLAAKHMSGRRGLCTRAVAPPAPRASAERRGFSSFFSRFWIVTPTAVLTIKATVDQRC
jgi:hypothetical protein